MFTKYLTCYVVGWKCCSFIWDAAGMGDMVQFSLNGIFTGSENAFIHFLPHVFFFASAILTEMYFLSVCVYT